MTPNFPRRRTLPMRPSSYRVGARNMRKMADQIEARAEAQTPQEKRALTLAVHRMARYAKDFSRRHRRSDPNG